MFAYHATRAAVLVAAVLHGASAFVSSPPIARRRQGMVAPTAAASFLRSTCQPFCVQQTRRTTHHHSSFERGECRATVVVAAGRSTSEGKGKKRGASRRLAMTLSSAGPGQGKFFRMGGAEDNQSFGPRCILAGGLSPEDSSAVLSILEREREDDGDGRGSTPPDLVLFTPDLAHEPVGDVLADAAAISRNQAPFAELGFKSLTVASLGSPVILVSGFTNPELREFAARFREATGVRAAFAKAVPNAMVKPVERLFAEIAQDHADAMAGRLHGDQGQQ